MTANRFGISHSWPDPVARQEHPDRPGDYDFHAHRPDGTDVFWAWALVVALLLLTTLIL